MARVRLVAVLCGATLLAAGVGEARAQEAAASIEELSRSLQATARQVQPAVVEIFSTSYAPGEGLVPRSADLVTRQRASGSGVIVGADGYIVTNAHVVRGADRLRVELPMPVEGESILSARSRSLAGRVVGIDAETDLAVVKVEAAGLPVLAFGDSDALRPGQVVLALGSPLGFENSVSLGVVSAVARQLQPESPMIYVQTDASINAGSSGGPLVDLGGRLIGINTLTYSEGGSNEGLTFAAPSNIVRTVFEQIRDHGRVRRGDIGVRAQTVTPVLAAGLQLPRDAGVIVADVAPGSMSERAGVRPGDLVLSLDGKPMENGRQLAVNVYQREVGEVVTLELQRGGERMQVPVAVSERDGPLSGLAARVDARDNIITRLGILGVTVNPHVARMLPALRVPSGVVVTSLAANALESREGGLAPGDVVHEINGTAVTGVVELRDALSRLQPGDPVVLRLERQGHFMYLAFTID